MKFLFLITHYYPHVFGAELFAQKLAEDLVIKGHEVHVVTGEWDDSWQLQEQVNGVQIYRVRSPHVRYLQTLLYIQPQLSFARMLHQQNHYDFIHAHIYPSLFNGYRLKTQDSRLKTIVTIQGGDLGDYPEIYGPFGSLAARIIGRSLAQYDKIHAVSTNLANQIKNLSTKEAHVIPNGVNIANVPSLQRSEFTSIQTQYLAVSPSRLTDKNNLFATIDAIKLLRDQNINIGLVIVGSGHLESQLKQYIKNTPLYRYIGVLGSVDHQRMLQIIKSSDIVVRPSKQEGFGIALLEGMGLEVPVVATTNGGLADFVSEDTAYVCGVDSESIAQAIKLCIQNPELRQQKVTHALKLAQSYSWDTVTARCRKELYGIN